MNHADMLTILTEIAVFFDKFAVTDEKVMAWHKVFKNYDTKTMLAAVDEYAMTNSYAPTPDKLRMAYFAIVKKHQAEEEERIRTRARGMNCEFCEGSGYFRVMEGGCPCVAPCRCRGNTKALAYYQAPENGYIWNAKKKMFEKRTAWIGDEDAKTERRWMDYDNFVDSFSF